MGANVSYSAQSVIQQTMRDVYTSLINSALTYTTNTIHGRQIQETDFSGAVINCPVRLEQVAEVKNRVYQPMTVERKNEFLNDFKNELESAFKQKVKQENKQLNLLQTNADILESRVANLDYTKIATTIANTTQSVVNNQIDISQEQRKYFVNARCEGDRASIEVVQNLKVDNVVENVMDSAETNQIVNDIATELTADLDVTKEQSNIGMFAGIIAAIIIIIIVAAVLGVVGIIPNPFKKKNGKKS
jgi:hypothetical protein